MKLWLFPPILALLAAGCTTRHAVITSTGNVFGFELAQNPSSGMYQAKLGYARTEFAYVPSNRSTSTNETSFGLGARDVPDVLMELKFQNVFKGGGLYQRLAIGTVAVSQPGAAFMFAKGPDGTLDPDTAAAIANVKTIPEAKPDLMAALAPLANAYQNSMNQNEFDMVAAGQGYPSFQTFLTNPNLTLEGVYKMADELRKQGLIE